MKEVGGSRLSQGRADVLGVEVEVSSSGVITAVLVLPSSRTSPEVDLMQPTLSAHASSPYIQAGPSTTCKPCHVMPSFRVVTHVPVQRASATSIYARTSLFAPLRSL